jgi:hypothetical protein
MKFGTHVIMGFVIYRLVFHSSTISVTIKHVRITIMLFLIHFLNHVKSFQYAKLLQ